MIKLQVHLPYCVITQPIHLLLSCTHLLVGHHADKLESLCFFDVQAVHFDVMIQPLLDDKEPCYLFFRLDETDAQNQYKWIFMRYSPDEALVSPQLHFYASKYIKISTINIVGFRRAPNKNAQGVRADENEECIMKGASSQDYSILS